MFRRRSKPLDTPVTMLLTRARVVPAMAQLFFASLAGEKLTTPSSTLTRTSGLAVMESSPLGPFTLTTSPSRATATPEGSVIGYFAIRDISRKRSEERRVGRERSALGLVNPYGADMNILTDSAL